MFLAMYHLFRMFGISLIRIIKQPHPKLYPQHICYTAINRLHGNLSFTNSLPKRTNEVLGQSKVSTHIQSRIYYLGSSIYSIGSHLMLGIKKFYRFTVRHYITFEAPFVAKYFSKEMIASGNRFTIIVIIRTHNSQCSGFAESLAERFDIKSSHLTRCYVWIGTGTGITPTDRDTIYCKVFGSGNQPFLLKSFNHPFSKFSHQKRILSITFYYTSPTRILCNIQNRRINISIT